MGYYGILCCLFPGGSFTPSTYYGVWGFVFLLDTPKGSLELGFRGGIRFKVAALIPGFGTTRGLGSRD